MTRPVPTHKLVGLVRIREHCVFTWERPTSGGHASARVRQTHCPECVAEIQRLGYVVLPEDQEVDTVHR